MNNRFQTTSIGWLLLLVAILTIASLFFLTIFGFGEFTDDVNQPGVRSEHAQKLLNSQYEHIRILKSEIQYLKEKVQKLEKLLNETQQRAPSVTANFTEQLPNKIQTTRHPSSANFDCTAYLRKQVGDAEIFHGLRFNNEFEMIPFNHFTFNRIYPIYMGLQKPVATRPIGRKREDLLAALSKAIDSLNKNASFNEGGTGGGGNQIAKFSYNDFLEGIYRTDPKTGTHYELYFQRNSEGEMWKDVKKVIVMKPFAPWQTINVQTISNPLVSQTKRSDEDIIHIILPLSGRIPQLVLFIKNFIEILTKKDELINLTVVYFGLEGFSEARKVLVDAAKELQDKASKIQMVQGNETFSRARGLQIGAESCVKLHKTSDTTNALLFMCDVDIIFNEKFLSRCRWNSEPGKMAYFPAVFSLYNPQVVYTLQGKEIPDIATQMQITKENGFWRDFGFGMTCQYRSDFLKLGGFDQEIIGWGFEDVMLYRKYIRSSLKIIRATDPGIFHMWHPKVCEAGKHKQKLSLQQYLSCIRSRALNEASHAQLGFLAFRDEIAAEKRNLKHRK